MSDGWITDAINRLRSSADQAARNTAATLDKYMDAGGRLNKVVFAVNAVDAKIVILK